VVFLRHAGVECAIPAQQVRVAGRDDPSGEPMLLFGRSTSDDDTRTLTVDTADGVRVVPCAGVRFGTLQDASVFPLPDVLRDELRMPRVVGVAATPDGMIWLVDLLNDDAHSGA
jgi:hypothetical protein